MNLKVENMRRLKVVLKEGLIFKAAEGCSRIDSFIRVSEFLIVQVGFNSSHIKVFIEEAC